MYWMKTRKTPSYPSTVLSLSPLGKLWLLWLQGKMVPFVVASDLVHQVVLGIDILDNETWDLAHGLAVIPKLAFEGKLERSGVGGIFLSVNRLQL